MSDAMSDAAAVGRLGERVLDCTDKLKVALEAANEGYRGMRPHLGDMIYKMNRILYGSGFEIKFTGR